MKKKNLINFVGNGFFSVTFVKKNGEKRTMNCRLGVKKHLKGGQKSYDDANYNYLTVYDLKKKGYRTVNLDTLISVKANGGVMNVN
jgi:hypothetical protein